MDYVNYFELKMKNKQLKINNNTYIRKKYL